MFPNPEVACFRYQMLAALDFGIDEFFNLAAVHADEMVVMPVVGELEHGLARFEEVSFQQAGLLELGQHPINGCETDVHSVVDEDAIDILRRQMPVLRLLKEFEDLEPGVGSLQPHALEVLRILGHRLSMARALGPDFRAKRRRRPRSAI